MRIFMYISDLGAGGAERVCVNLANGFVENGHEVHIIILNQNKDVYSHLLNTKVFLHSLNVSRIRYSIVPMLKLLNKEKAPLILAFGNQMGMLLSKCRRWKLLRCKIIVRVLNNMEITLSKEEKGSGVIEKIIKKNQYELGHVDYVITQCAAMEKMFRKQIDLKNKSKYIYNPVSQYLVEKTELIPKNKDSEKHIGFIGRLDPQKNIEHLLKAFHLVLKEKINTILYIYGVGIHEEQARSFVKELNIEEYVKFEGLHKDMENVYAHLDMLVLSSLYEGMPNSLIESISVGIPVVSYDCPIGPSEIIEEGVNGYLIPMGDINALADGIKKCLIANWDRSKIKESAKKFQTKQIVMQYEAIFREV